MCSLKTLKKLLMEYVKFGESLLELVPRGVSGAVYTQTTDVEVEVNGLMTYDRKAIKIEEERVREIIKKYVTLYLQNKGIILII